MREISLVRPFCDHIYTILSLSVVPLYIFYENLVVVVTRFSPILRCFFCSSTSSFFWYMANTYPNDNRGDFSCILILAAVLVVGQNLAKMYMFSYYIVCIMSLFCRYTIIFFAFKPPNYVCSLLSCCWCCCHCCFRWSPSTYLLCPKFTHSLISPFLELW